MKGKTIISSMIGACFIFLSLTTGASALEYITIEGAFLYFPEDEHPIATRLVKKLPDMLSFLSSRGLRIKPGLHIVLDEELDAPHVEVHVIPHREIRIPLRAPGVLEDGYLEADPWSYYLFKGLCLHGIYGIRSGIPGVLSRGFGELISPNAIIPPWVEEGICNLLHAQYGNKQIQDPFEKAIFDASPPPDLDIFSNHPEAWPGYYGYRIYGKPFIFWLYQKFGWDKIIEFLELHGRGIVPIEIDLKARKAFGKTWIGLWSDFQMAQRRESSEIKGLTLTGYWAEPFTYWNHAGVYPGNVQVRNRGRYGVAEPDGTLWLSQYDEGTARIHKYAKGTTSPGDLKHIWDPGPGGAAVTRRGRHPQIIVFPDDDKGGFRKSSRSDMETAIRIPGPPGALQMSGPVRDHRGRIAVSVNHSGNWDIWMHDGRWRRLTKSASIELDPWWENDILVYASNQSSAFQIHALDQSQLTQAEHGAMLPRQGKFLNLGPSGWRLNSYEKPQVSSVDPGDPAGATDEADPQEADLKAGPYTPFPSIWPNYIRPDAFATATDFQLGLATASRDVTGRYLLNGGIRYSNDTDFIALRAGLQIVNLGSQVTRYPLSYETRLGQTVDEARNEFKLFWRPFEAKETMRVHVLRPAEGFEVFKGIEFSLNGRSYEPLQGEGKTAEEGWVSVAFSRQNSFLSAWGDLELFTENRQALSGGLRLSFGDSIFTSLHMMGGKSWGEPVLGHDTFRVGGNVSEGYFTGRTSRLFPLRGFDSNLLEASQAAATNLEVFWPLANLQAGYATLPVFFHRLRLGTFVDAGFADERIASEDLLVGAGFELVTSLEIAWGNLSTLRIGLAWPLVQSDFLDQSGPVFIFQIGQPL